LLCSTDLNAFTSVDFKLNKGLIFIKGEVDGEKGNFIFDTGTSYLFLNGTPNRVEAVFETVDQELVASQQQINKLKLGLVEQNNLAGWLTDLSNLEQSLDKQISGVIGFSFFSNYNVLIDYESQKIHLYALDEHLPLSYKTNVQNAQIFDFTLEGLPVVDLKINDQVFKIGLDTGANFSVFGEQMSEHIFISNQFDSKQSLAKIKIGNITIIDLPAQFVDLQKLSETHKLDGILGLSSLKVSQVYIDNQQKKLCLKW